MIRVAGFREARCAGPRSTPQPEMFTHEPNSVRILSTPKTYSSGTIHAGSHHQEFAVLVEFVGLREVPDRPLGLVIASATKNPAACVVILELLCPLPDISDQVHHPKGARALRMRVDCVRPAHGTTLVRNRNGFRFPGIPPGIGPTIGALSSVLPFAFVRQALPCPGRIDASVFDRHPRHRPVVPAIWIFSILPV